MVWIFASMAFLLSLAVKKRIKKAPWVAWRFFGTREALRSTECGSVVPWWGMKLKGYFWWRYAAFFAERRSSLLGYAGNDRRFDLNSVVAFVYYLLASFPLPVFHSFHLVQEEKSDAILAQSLMAWLCLLRTRKQDNKIYTVWLDSSYLGLLSIHITSSR